MAASASGAETPTLNLFPMQYRTFDRVYAVKVENPAPHSGLTLRVLTLAQQSLGKVLIAESEIHALGEETSTLVHRAMVERKPAPVLRILLREGVLPKDYFPDLVEELLSRRESSSASSEAPSEVDEDAVGETVASADEEVQPQSRAKEVKDSLLTLIKKEEEVLLVKGLPSGEVDLEELEDLVCPITQALFKDPV